jgi:hypothetical protein
MPLSEELASIPREASLSVWLRRGHLGIGRSLVGDGLVDECGKCAAVEEVVQDVGVVSHRQGLGISCRPLFRSAAN